MQSAYCKIIVKFYALLYRQSHQDWQFSRKKYRCNMGMTRTLHRIFHYLSDILFIFSFLSFAMQDNAGYPEAGSKQQRNPKQPLTAVACFGSTGVPHKGNFNGVSFVVRVLFAILRLAYLADGLRRASRRAACTIPGLGVARIALADAGMGTVTVRDPIAIHVPERSE